MFDLSETLDLSKSFPNTFFKSKNYRTPFSEIMPNFYRSHAMSIRKIQQFPWSTFILLLKLYR